MRLIHTADWHIGQTLNGWPREHEHAALLARLPDLVEALDADALVVAGDVFDGIHPSAEAMQLFYDTLLAVHRRRPRLTMIVVAGNHDPAGRLEAPASVLRTIGVHAVGTLRRRGGRIDLDHHLVPLTDRHGAVGAHVLAIPFLRAADLGGLGAEGEEGSPVVGATRRLYAEAVADARARLGPDMRLVATGHLHCAGGELSEGAERRILIGGEHAVPPDVFPADLAYVALGHLHRPQAVGHPGVRYSGSLFPLSATELGYGHGVSLVELGPEGVVHRHVPMERPVPCLRVPEQGALGLDALPQALAALALDPATPVERRAFVHVVLQAEGPAAGLAAEAERLLEDYPVRCAGIRVERPSSGDATPPVAEPVRPLAEHDPADLFERAFEAVHGVEPGPAHRAAFHRAAAGE